MSKTLEKRLLAATDKMRAIHESYLSATDGDVPPDASYTDAVGELITSMADTPPRRLWKALGALGRLAQRYQEWVASGALPNQCGGLFGPLNALLDETQRLTETADAVEERKPHESLAKLVGDDVGGHQIVAMMKLCEHESGEPVSVTLEQVEELRRQIRSPLLVDSDSLVIGWARQPLYVRQDAVAEPEVPVPAMGLISECASYLAERERMPA